MSDIRIDDHAALAFALDSCKVNKWDCPHTISLHDRRGIRAVVVYERFSECDCNMHVASDGSRRWLTREYLAACFAYPFVQLGLRRVTSLVRADNHDSLRFNRHLGFQIEGVCRDAFPDTDMVILGMLRSDCRYLPNGGFLGL